MGRPQAEIPRLWGPTRLAKVPKSVFHMELQFSARPQPVTRSSRRARHGGKLYFCVRVKGDRAHLGVPHCTSPGSGCLQRTHGEGSRSWQTVGVAGTRGGDISFWPPRSFSRFHPSLEGRLRGLSRMRRMGAGGLILLHPTTSREEKPHKRPLFPPHSCSSSCNWASINPCPSPAGLNWGGSAHAAVELGYNPGGNPHPLPPGDAAALAVVSCFLGTSTPRAHPLCSTRVLHRRVLRRWAHLQPRCRPTPVAASSIK